MQQSYGPAGGPYGVMRDRFRTFLFNRLRCAHHAILSGESLSGKMSAASLSDLRMNLLALGFRDFRIVIYVRDPADFYLSAV